MQKQAVAVCGRNKKTNQKSPFYPQMKIRTLVEYDEYSRTYYANAKGTGYVAENLNNNSRNLSAKAQKETHSPTFPNSDQPMERK